MRILPAAPDTLRSRSYTAAIAPQETSPSLALMLVDAGEYVQAARAARVPTRECSSVADLCTTLSRCRVSAVIADVRDTHGVRIDAALTAAATAGLSVTVRVGLLPHHIRDIVALARQEHAFRFAIAESNNSHCLLSRTLDRIEGPQQLMIRAASSACPAYALRVVAAAIVLGERRRRIEWFAQRVGASTRTLERQLSQELALPPRKLLADTLTLHALWKRERHGLTLKRVANEAGFTSADSLSQFVRRHTGRTLRDLERFVGFDEMLMRFVACLAAKNASTRTSIDRVSRPVA